jgi:hypothetical protein
MPLVVYLVPNQTGVVRRGDMVFHVAECKGGKWQPRWMVHTGIAEQTAEDFELCKPASVIHMGNYISRDYWSGGLRDEDSRIDACGSHPEIDDLTRDNIIDEARLFYEIDPSIFQQSNVRSCYWMGDPLPSGHPLFPRIQNVYGFSCSTFAHYCYLRAVGAIVDTSAMPLVTNAERAELEAIVGRYRVQPGPFSRLYPSYLMNAFRADSYPFSPEDWEDYKLHGIFIPREAA